MNESMKTIYIEKDRWYSKIFFNKWNVNINNITLDQFISGIFSNLYSYVLKFIIPITIIYFIPVIHLLYKGYYFVAQISGFFVMLALLSLLITDYCLKKDGITNEQIKYNSDKDTLCIISKFFKKTNTKPYSKTPFIYNYCDKKSNGMNTIENFVQLCILYMGSIPSNRIYRVQFI